MSVEIYPSHTDNLKRFLTQNENLMLLKTYVNKALFFKFNKVYYWRNLGSFILFGSIQMVNNSVCFSGKKKVCTAPEPVLLQTHQIKVFFS